MARESARKSGEARVKRLSTSERRRVAALDRRARELSFHAARRVAENFRYVEVMDALQPRPKVIRLRSFSGALLGIAR